MNLDEFRRAYEADDNEWWRHEPGEHQNWFDDAIERLEAAEVENARITGERDLLKGRITDYQTALQDQSERVARFQVDLHEMEAALRKANEVLIEANDQRIKAEEHFAAAVQTVGDRDATIEGLHSYCEKADALIDKLRRRLRDHGLDNE